MGPLTGRPARAPVTLLPFRVRDAGFFDGTRFAGTGWPGARGLGGQAAPGPGVRVEMVLGLPGPASPPGTALVYRWRGESWPGCPHRPKVLMCRDVRPWAGAAAGATVNAALVPRKMRGCAMITEIPPAVATTAGPAGAAGSMRTG